MVPKINVYVPDELAEAVKEAGIPVSAVCQRALETAVRRVTAIREAVISPASELDESPGRMTHFTPRARNAVKLGVRAARANGSPEVGTGHLLAGVLDTEGNLAVQVLQAIEIDPEQIRRELDRLRQSTPSGAETAPAKSETKTQPNLADAASGAAGEGELRIGNQAAAALELAVTEATSFGHNYVGCEHILLGLIAEPDGEGGRILRTLGAELRLTRRAVAAALAGFVHLRAQQNQNAPSTPAVTDPMEKLAALIDQQLKPVVQRLERLENNLGPGGRGLGGNG